MATAGILSDIHLQTPTSLFIRQIQHAFDDCEIIICAGDITDLSLLKFFRGKEVYAVHGNSCNFHTRAALPTYLDFTILGYTFGLSHGTGNRLNIEERMFEKFANKDCIIFGHSHKAVISHMGDSLLINPGTFQSSGPYGAPGTYCRLNITHEGLHPQIFNLPQNI